MTPLTKAERRVLVELLNPEVAHTTEVGVILDIQPVTVKKHITNILSKYNKTNTFQLVKHFLMLELNTKDKTIEEVIDGYRLG